MRTMTVWEIKDLTNIWPTNSTTLRQFMCLQSVSIKGFIHSEAGVVQSCCAAASWVYCGEGRGNSRRSVVRALWGSNGSIQSWVEGLNGINGLCGGLDWPMCGMQIQRQKSSSASHHSAENPIYTAPSISYPNPTQPHPPSFTHPLDTPLLCSPPTHRS